ncbi:MAG: TonB-dependent receptor [Acidobacteriota bacterium]
MIRARPRSTPLPLLASLTVSALLWWRPAAAEADETPPRPQGPVETIEVRGETDALGPLDPSAFASVIRADQFAGRITTLPELLREAVGVQIKSLGGAFATVSIRGSSAEQVVVYLDGVPLNRALGGAVNLNDLPLGQVESIQIYRGTTPASLSSASIGGAVLIRTRRAREKRSATASVGFGSFDTGELTGFVSGTAGHADLSIGFDALRTDGDFTFRDNNGTPFTAADDGDSRRTNNDRRRLHLTGRASFALGRRARLDLSTDLLGAENGVPGLDARQSEHARFETSRLLTRAGLEVPELLGGRLLLRGALDHTRYREGLSDPFGEISFLPTETDTRIASFGQEVGLVLVATRRQAVSVLASHRRETAELDGDGPGAPDGGAASRDLVVATIEDQISLAGDRLVINPSLRHERWENRFRPGEGAVVVPQSLRGSDGRTNGRIGLRWRIGTGLTFKANAGRFLRLPDFIELFGNAGSILGNPALRPESGRTVDLGIAATRRPTAGTLRRARVELTLFETRAEDLIIFEPKAQSIVIARNIPGARIRGIELSIALAAGPRLSGSLNATHQRAVDESGGPSDGKLLPGRPIDELSARAGIDIGRGHLYYEFTYVGENFVDRQNIDSEALPPRYLHDVGYRLDLPHGLRVVLEVRNLGNERTFDVARFPLPGRSVHGRLSWEF